MSGDRSQGATNKSASENMSQIVPVRVAGHEYKIRSSGDPEELQQIAGYVDRAMKRVRERTGTVDTLDVAVLTCLNLAREILGHRQRDQQGSAAGVVDADQLRSLIERVESVLVVDQDESSASKNEDAEERARTLELPSVESLRDRNASASDADSPESDQGETISESRVASGGRRDRAS